ncbi:LOW QUALITY PROTEIN: hypothetical protein CVT26_012191 [Gymnopilus dilepis]|uniref:Uncharacterized protein n=1 Tax=Gymnopilus dilepis TaxID=231916 RepID=A0A409W9I6_9AGAR|nr:LOW QUALITY PROTEIN: hypothetical protein CVT26_012191 [Gymnopilus dilepis]
MINAFQVFPAARAQCCTASSRVQRMKRIKRRSKEKGGKQDQEENEEGETEKQGTPPHTKHPSQKERVGKAKAKKTEGNREESRVTTRTAPHQLVRLHIKTINQSKPMHDQRPSYIVWSCQPRRREHIKKQKRRKKRTRETEESEQESRAEQDGYMHRTPPLSRPSQDNQQRRRPLHFLRPSYSHSVLLGTGTEARAQCCAAGSWVPAEAGGAKRKPKQEKGEKIEGEAKGEAKKEEKSKENKRAKNQRAEKLLTQHKSSDPHPPLPLP